MQHAFLTPIVAKSAVTIPSTFTEPCDSFAASLSAKSAYNECVFPSVNQSGVVA